MKPWTLSYTAYSKWCLCPHSFKLHYVDKIQPMRQPAHLLFGSATDAALNVVLERWRESKEDSFEAAMFAAEFELQRIFKDQIMLEKTDFDYELITARVESELLVQLRTVGYQGDDWAGLATYLFSAPFTDLSENQKKAKKILVFFSFSEKIALIVRAFQSKILPQIKSIVSVQKKVKRGKLDFEATFHSYGDIPITVDNKTSSRPYERDAIEWSVQLAGYEARHAMYIVFNKQVRKNRIKICSKCGHDGTGRTHKSCDKKDKEGLRCSGEWQETVKPEIVPQIVFGEVPELNREIVEKAFQDVEKALVHDVFPRNLQACGNQFGKPCVYRDLCWKNSMKGLKKEERK